MGRIDITDKSLLVATTHTDDKGQRVVLVMGDRGLDMSPAAALTMSKALLDAALGLEGKGVPRGDPDDARLHDMDKVLAFEGPPPGLQ